MKGKKAATSRGRACRELVGQEHTVNINWRPNYIRVNKVHKKKSEGTEEWFRTTGKGAWQKTRENTSGPIKEERLMKRFRRDFSIRNSIGWEEREVDLANEMEGERDGLICL